MTKTYEQRLDEIAEEFAKANLPREAKWDNQSLGYQIIQIERMKPLAAIALKHMAEAYENGYKSAYNDGDNAHYHYCQQQLQSLGLIQPQKP